jgi:excisionase family DNA binding protein
MREEIAPIIEKLRELEDMIRDLGQDLGAEMPGQPSTTLLKLHPRQPQSTTKQLKDIKWAADYLGVGIYRIYDLIRLNAIPFTRLGKSQFRFSEEALAEWVAQGGTAQDQRRNGQAAS